MAQHLYASSDQITTAANIPVVPTYFVDSFPPPSTPIIKKEISGANDLSQTEDISRPGRSKKRQKISQEGSSHKFVSQKKWKFSDGQPWLPSKTSSKAQNASKANSKRREVSSNSQQMSISSRLIEPRRYEGGSTRKTVQQNKPLAQNPLDVPSVQDGMSADVVTKQKTNVPLSSGQPSQSNQRMSEIQTTRSEPDMQSAEVPLEPGPYPQEQYARPGLLPDASQPLPSSTLRNMLGRPKTSRSAHALSLEKDAGRIAALIAAKRKENESSMFRERMLRRQLEHKNQNHNMKHSSKATEVSDDQDDADSAYSRSPSIAGNDTPSPIESSLPSVAASAEPPKMGIASQMIQSVDVPEVRVVKSVRSRSSRAALTTTVEESKRISRSGESDQDAQSAGSISKSASMVQISGQDKHGSAVAVPRYLQSASAADDSMQAESERLPYLQRPHERSGPFQAEDADVRSEFIAFTNQLLKRGSSQPAQSADVSNRRSLHHEPSARQSTSPLPPAQVQALQRTSSASSLTLRGSTNRPVSSVPSSSSLSSQHSLMSISIRQRPRRDLAPQHHPPTTFVSTSDSGISIQPRENTLDPHSYHMVNQQILAPSNSLVDHPGHFSQVNYPTNPGSTAPSINVNTTMPITAAQQQLPQPPVLVSNMNMFSGNARSDSGNGMGTLTPKPRVNMFGNTRGVPFTMHEVIRQIEMT